MKVTATYQGKKHVIELKERSTVRQLLETMKINPETVLVGRKKEIIPETTLLADKDSVELIRVISGG